MSFFVTCVLSIACAAHAEDMVSENFSLMKQGVGSIEGSILTSEQFTLTPVPGESYAHGEGELPPRRGGDGKTVTTTPSVLVTDVVGGSVLVPEGLRSTFSNSQNRGGVAVADVSSAPTLPDDPSFTPVNIIPEKSVGNAQSASVLGATREYVNDAGVLLSDTFRERSARVAFFLFVLVMLYLIRTHTEIGKKYRPF